MNSEKIDISFKAVEVIQSKGKQMSNGTKAGTMTYVTIPDHWMNGKIVLALVQSDIANQKEE